MYVLITNTIHHHLLLEVIKKVTENKATHLDGQLLNIDSCVSVDIKDSTARSGESTRAVEIV